MADGTTTAGAVAPEIELYFLDAATITWPDPNGLLDQSLVIQSGEELYLANVQYFQGEGSIGEDGAALFSFGNLTEGLFVTGLRSVTTDTGPLPDAARLQTVTLGGETFTADGVFASLLDALGLNRSTIADIGDPLAAIRGRLTPLEPEPTTVSALTGADAEPFIPERTATDGGGDGAGLGTPGDSAPGDGAPGGGDPGD